MHNHENARNPANSVAFRCPNAGSNLLKIEFSQWSVCIFIVQELCESRGGHPGLFVPTSLLVSVDVKQYWTMLRHWSQLVNHHSRTLSNTTAPWPVQGIEAMQDYDMSPNRVIPFYGLSFSPAATYLCQSFFCFVLRPSRFDILVCVFAFCFCFLISNISCTPHVPVAS